MVVPYLVDAGAEFLIRVTGNSMYPTYANGDILACRRVRESRNIQWGKVYVIDSEEGPMVKRIRPSDDEERILCHSDNPDYAPFTLRKSEIRSLALVVGSIQVE
jgi:phage repressor protein C with HTH and peptisase S24 domain